MLLNIYIPFFKQTTKTIEWKINENVQNENDENSCVIVDYPETSADVSCEVNDLGTGIVGQDQSTEPIDDESVPDVGPNATDTEPSSDEIPVEESSTTLANDEVQPNETELSSSTRPSTRHVSGKKWLFFHVFKSIY